MKPDDIQFNTAELKTEWEIISKSRMSAMLNLIRKHYLTVFGLAENDPPELWRYAVGLSEKPPDLSGNMTAKKLVEHFRQIEPQFAGSPETYELFRKSLGSPTLRETTLALVEVSTTDDELAPWLTKLSAIHKRGPVSQAELESTEDKTKQILLACWIREPFGNITGSLAFFNDEAMAKMVSILAEKVIKPGRINAEADRVRKVYRSLGLRPAARRAIKDIKPMAGKIHFDIYKARTPKGR